MKVIDRPTLATKLNIAANHITRIREKLGHSEPSNSEIPETEAAEVELAQEAIKQGKTFEDAIASVIEARITKQSEPKASKSGKAADSITKRQQSQQQSKESLIANQRKASGTVVQRQQKRGRTDADAGAIAYADQLFKRLGDNMQIVNQGIDAAFDIIDAEVESEQQSLSSSNGQPDFLPKGQDDTQKALGLVGWG